MLPAFQRNRPAPSGLRHSWRTLTDRLSPGGTVLAFHGVRGARDVGEVGTMHVSSERLGKTVRVLKQMTTLVPLAELVARHRRGQPTKGLSALTFDDAYASAGSAIEQLVETESVPVSLFVV